MDKPVIGFIGGGNMARSLIGGLLATGWPRERLLVSEPDAEKRAFFADEVGIGTRGDNAVLVADAAVVVLAVKPQVMAEVLRPLAPAVQASTPLVVSIAAGVRCRDIDRWLGGGVRIVRVMPNTPSLIGAGASGMFAYENVSEAQRELAQTIARAVGIAAWVDREELIDTVTGLSGSGPAYFFYLMEAMENAAVDGGLARSTARLLTLQTALGAARLALEGGEDPATLRERVTSPNGTTASGIATLDKHDVRTAIQASVAAAAARAAEMADELADPTDGS